ncbi:hypothetical protein [Lactobacillus agrestimuris]|uniref:hypothetical protein n=1 Tax=Lactobacillus agrestimuris TaxID=2941328 RepID=UPI002042D3C5|nr:hypothetical protein [Lactobacillus agrestimuris]
MLGNNQKKYSYVIATMGILASIIIGAWDASWSTSRIAAFVISFVITIIGAVSVVRSKSDN